MAGSIAVEQSRAIPVAVELAFSRTLPMPLPELFSRWYGVIPPIKEVCGQTGSWGTPGQTRTVVLAGGGSAQEELTGVDPPRSFSYTLSGIRGPLALLASSVEGKWSFVPAGDGTNVIWQWTIHARSGLSAPLLPVFGRIWRGYARGALERLSAALVD